MKSKNTLTVRSQYDDHILFEITVTTWETYEVQDEVDIEYSSTGPTSFIQKWLDFGLHEWIKNDNGIRTFRETTKEHPEFLNRLSDYLTFHYNMKTEIKNELD